MKAVKARITHALSHGSHIEPCDNSGAKLVRIVSFIGSKTVKGRKPSGGIGQLVLVAVRKGTPEMRKQVVYAVIVRQRKEYRRMNGDRIKFEDNAVVVVKDDKGNPKGTILKGPIPKEVCERWPPIAKLASMIV
jgi:large subunit ribosomal protein L14